MHGSRDGKSLGWSTTLVYTEISQQKLLYWTDYEETLYKHSSSPMTNPTALSHDFSSCHNEVDICVSE